LYECPKSATISTELRRTTKKLGYQEDIKLLLKADLPGQKEIWVFKRIIDLFRILDV